MKVVLTDGKRILSELIFKLAAYARVSSGKDAMLHSLCAQVSYFSSYMGTMTQLICKAKSAKTVRLSRKLSEKASIIQ